MLKTHLSDILSYICSTILFLIVVSCSNGNKEQNPSLETYSLADCDTGSISDIFSDVELTALKFDGKYYPKSVERIFIDSGMIFIVDSKNNVYIFSEDGTPISSSLSMRGDGPGEHPIVMGYSWNPYSQLGEIITPELLMFYDKNFNYVKSTKLESRRGEKTRKGQMYNSIFDLSSDLHLLSPTGASERPCRFIVYDSSQEKNIGEISYEEDVWSFINMQSNNFFVMPDSSIICHPSALLPYTYRLDPHDLTLNKIITLESDSRCITQHEINNISGDNKKISNYLLNCDKSIPLNTIVTPNKMFVTLKSGNTIRTFYTVVFDRNSSDKKEFRHYTDDKCIFPRIGYATDEYAYSVVDKDILENNTALYLDNPEYISDIDSIDNEDWILLKYKYKSTR